jgi:hypothetical protein
VDAPSTTLRADLHVHSACSENPTAKAIRFFRSRESFTSPEDVYASARARGMDFVTITDHNTLNGSLAIAHLPGTFLGCELDTWFPEDDCRVHVVALGIDEATFAEAMQVKTSIYDLVALLREAGVAHYLAHPLFDMTGKLTPDIVEKMLLLFNVLEGRNGARVVRCNGLLREVVAALTPEAIWDMAERQGIEPYGETPWRKGLTGGSDDHSGLFTAGAYTVAGGDGSPQGFLESVARGDCRAGGEDSDARLLAHSIYTTSFWRLREMLRMDTDQPRQHALGWIKQGFGRIGRDVPLLEKTVRGVRSVAPGLYRPEDGRGPAWEDLLDREIGSLLREPEGMDTVGSRELNRRIFAVSSTLAADVLNLHLEPLLDPAARRPGWRRRDSLFAVGMVHFLELAYFIAYGFQTRDRAEQEGLREYFLGPQTGGPRIAVFTDAPPAGSDCTAVARRFAAATGRPGAALEVLTAAAAPAGAFPGGVRFAASAAWPSRLQPGRTLVAPPLLDVLDYLYEKDFTAIHVDSAGGMGLAGLLAAKVLHLPVTGTVHTDVLLAVERLSSGSRASREAWRYVRWFAGMLDEAFTQSRADARRLVALGVDPRRVHPLPVAAPVAAISAGGRDDGERGEAADGVPEADQATAAARACVWAPDPRVVELIARLERPSPAPGWRHAADLRSAVARRNGRRRATGGVQDPGRRSR